MKEEDDNKDEETEAEIFCSIMVGHMHSFLDQ